MEHLCTLVEPVYILMPVSRRVIGLSKQSALTVWLLRNSTQRTCNLYIFSLDLKEIVIVGLNFAELGNKIMNNFISNRCQNLQDGLYSDPSNCASMFWCSNGYLQRGTCPSGQLFDADLGLCNFFMSAHRFSLQLSVQCTIF